MMFVTLKIFHFIGLMLGGGAGFGLMLLAPALRRADAAGKAALMPLRPKLANLGLLGIVLLWISGLGMAFMVGSYGLSGLWFGLKMLAAAGVLALAIFGFVMRRRAAAGQAVPAYALKIGILASPLSVLAVILAVLAFN
ncbi:hypothetical protein LGT41_0004515 [Abyssibius alkaniclasticus]|uniref:hypothetical protein n=1 Tax=Abyssibius alkaniclasticus TaxID=2881234 RepID=UPI0023638894|nr:hypothetical protein [Abyssibius alkaniclasticus]UPH72091.1 hypothetical protein LGT41_0004515 [Abyssibius alkaniclasticus]|tara:strand:+ start:1077 stop:1493 length:417 start_codon:yes stop_codon:yes gene_type:complete